MGRRAAELLCRLLVLETSPLQLPGCSCPQKHMLNGSLSLHSTMNNYLFSLYLYFYLHPRTHSALIQRQSLDRIQITASYFFSCRQSLFIIVQALHKIPFFQNFYSSQISLYCTIGSISTSDRLWECNSLAPKSESRMLPPLTENQTAVECTCQLN